MSETRTLAIDVTGAGDRTCDWCECPYAGEQDMVYCGIFRKPLRIDGAPVQRLPECLAAERRNTTPEIPHPCAGCPDDACRGEEDAGEECRASAERRAGR